MTDAIRALETLYRDWSRGDFKTSVDLLAPDIEWQQEPEAVEPGTRRGREEVSRMTRGVFEAFRNFRVEPIEFIPVGDQVVVVARLHGTARGTGLPLDRTAAQLWTFEGGKATRVAWYADAEAALAACQAP